MAKDSVLNKDAVERVELLFATIQERRACERIEKDLKDWFKDFLGESTSARVGDYVVTAVSKTRSVLDRDILVERFGAEAVSQFEKEVRYTEVNVSNEKDQPSP